MPELLQEASEDIQLNDLEACRLMIKKLVLALEAKDADIARLKEQLQNLLRGKYGRSSEKLSPGQLLLFGLDSPAVESAESPTGAETEQDAAKEINDALEKAEKRRGGGGRKRISASVKRERRNYFPNEEELTCNCGAQKQEIGSETIEQLDYIPASFLVIEHVTHKFACKTCQEGVVQGRRPTQIVNGGKPAEGMLAQISTAKYGDHLPLYRQEQIYAREGVELPRSSMGRWLDMTAQSAKLICDRMLELVWQSKFIEADESPVLFLDKNRLPKKSKKGYVWVLRGDDAHPYTIFDFQPDRCADRAKELLKGFENVLLTDGYGGYEWYQQSLSANCNVHARRYIEKAMKYDKNKAGPILALYSQLYKIEENNQHLSKEELLAVRQKESIPILEKIKTLLQSHQLTTPPKTSLGIAISYILARWEKLCRFTEHGFLKLDTNLVENAIRPIALGRKNWLHIGSEEALETASVHATLVNTCKRLGINPYLYLRDVFIRLGHGNVAVDDLLPDRWTNQNPISTI